MKFAIINDTHFGPPGSGQYKGIQRKLVLEAPRLIREFVEEMNDIEKPEFVIHLGDEIEDVNDRATDIQSFKEVLALFSKLDALLYYLVGNHDIRTLSVDDISNLVGYEKMYYAFSSGGYRFIALSLHMTGNHTQDLSDIGAEVPEEQVEWLIGELKNTDEPVVIFVHYPLTEDDMKGNFWFEDNPKIAVLENRKQLRKIFEDSGKVKAVFSGHQHWNRMHVYNGIPYFTLTALIENFNNDGIPANARTIVNLTDNKVQVDVKGNDSASYIYECSSAI